MIMIIVIVIRGGNGFFAWITIGGTFVWILVIFALSLLQTVQVFLL